jgi:acetyl-CoA carboxylase alpha subunit
MWDSLLLRHTCYKLRHAVSWYAVYAPEGGAAIVVQQQIERGRQPPQLSEL